MRPRAWWLAAAACALIGAGTADEKSPAEVHFSVLSYNVHGLPDWAVDDDPAARMPRIAEKLGAYDVVLIQEDWAYHELLTRDTGHELVERGNASRLALAQWIPLFSGSGLTVLARTSRTRLVQMLSEPYAGCSGWLSGANDCWATKGFTRMRLAFPGERVVDFYTTHLDAGGGEGDQAVRVEQMGHLARAIRKHSAGMPVVLAGDFNLHHDYVDERDVVDQFVRKLRLRRSDAQANPAWRSRVDYLWYRDGARHGLELLEAGQAHEFAHAGAPLSDHPALYGKFALSER